MQKDIIVGMDKVLMVWIEYHISYNVTNSQSLIPNMPNPFNLTKSEEAAEEKSEASTGWFIRFKERNCLHNTKKCRMKQPAGADVEAAASIIDRCSMYVKEYYTGRR
jgi:hypothetical protein